VLENLNEKMEKNIENKIQKLLNNFNLDGLEDVILTMKALKANETYERLFEAYKGEGFNRRFYYDRYRYRTPDKWRDKREIPNTRFFAETCINLVIPFQHSFLDIYNVYTLYHFLKLIYSMNMGEPVNREKLQNIYLNGLDERITFNLDKFDSEGTIAPNEDFFINIIDVHWQSKESKKLFNDLKSIKDRLIYGLTQMLKFNRIIQEENKLLKYFAACSALNEGQTLISTDDVIRSYNTYFKLLSSNITEYKVNSSHIFNGLIFCENCRSYYLLSKDESPDDFTNVCQCGGKLEYTGSIEDIKFKIDFSTSQLKYVTINVLVMIIIIVIPLSGTYYIASILNLDMSYARGKLWIILIGLPILLVLLFIINLLNRSDLKS